MQLNCERVKNINVNIKGNDISDSYAKEMKKIMGMFYKNADINVIY